MVTKKQNNKKQEYTAEDIFVLEGLDPVRKRPGMYIGSTGADGLHHLIWEVLANGIDECLGGFAKEIKLTLLPNNRIKCEDDGRGIPVDIHKQTKKSALETVMTTLHAGGKFGGKAYQIAGGLHGVGVSVVCALSVYLRAEICRDGNIWTQEYSKGKTTTKLKKDGKCKKTGTTIIFEPDIEIFKNGIEFQLKKILNYLRQQAYLTKGVKISISDQREERANDFVFYFEGGLVAYIKHLTRGQEPRNANIFYVESKKDDIIVEAAFQYTREYEYYEESFVNNIYTGEGGTHSTGFKSALTRALNDYARKNNFLKETDDKLSGDDAREGLTAVILAKIKDPQFEGQTKAKLGNPEAKLAVESVVGQALVDFLERNPNDAKAIIENCILSAKARKAARAARQTVLRKGVLEGLALPGKLADCSSKNPEESELYIVEGESAGGCFFGNTKVVLADGRNLSFKNLVKEDKQGKKNYCYTTKKDGSIGIELIKNPRKTKWNEKVIKIILDNDEEIICTPDHLFMLRNGLYKQAQFITPQDSLMPLNRQLSVMGKRITIKGYELVYDNKEQRWIFTHILSDKYNLINNVYSKEKGNTVHHIDFNKLNNNPDNLIRMPKKEHFIYHSKCLEKTLHTPEIKNKSKLAKQTKEYKEKISRIMSTPKMKKMLSQRAKKQWQNEEYKKYMVQKFLEFYKNNAEYREKNEKRLNENQEKYWMSKKNREKQSEKIKIYFEKHPEKRQEFSNKAKEQWQNKELLKWRKEKTKQQWTQSFRIKRKKAYNNTYLEKALKLLKQVFEQTGKVDKQEYTKQRLETNDKSILKYETICERFFRNNDQELKQAVLNYNHKIKKIIKLKKRIDVYDLEVDDTHNFALASGIFVHNSGKQGRDRRFQAILPLRGKILNVERARLDKILMSSEIKALVIALGTAISEDFNLEKLRYHRIILMSDADVDGAHIRTLLLTFFYRYFQPIIEKGYLYIAQPPLYKIQAGKQIEYAYTDEDKKEILDAMAKEKKATPSLQRYKGLGEMNPSELWETTMNPENRTLLQVTIEDAKEADKIFDILMGSEVMPRKKFIQVHAKKVKNLDI